ncbi:UNVERIFIED_CONTAM: hypothetical protein GTU68_003575 [Idotea baltica]|nr:hypothetical protein [Idotea baltica]
MSECISLAQGRFRQVSPNPMVGSIITNGEDIIAKGSHEIYGDSHAEVNALNQIKDLNIDKSNLNLFVNLEPCAHHGKTPPCAKAIIESGIKNVYIGSLDPNPKVSGKGIKFLKDNNINVIENVLNKKCEELNKRYFCFHKNKRPYIILKWAQTSDGFIAREDYSSKWISSLESRTLVHKWRSEENAILVGTNTAKYDNPNLTVRHAEGANPIRVLIDKELKIKENNILNKESNTIIFNSNKSEVIDNLNYIKIDFTENTIAQILKELYKLQIQSMIIEGGSKTIGYFIDNNSWDEARVFTSDQKFQSGVKAPRLDPQFIIKSNKINSDTLTILNRIRVN